MVDGRIRLLDPADPPPAHVGRTIDATGKVVAPGFIDLHSHGGAGDPGRPAARAEGPPGRDDRGRRRRRQRLRAVPRAARTSRRSSTSTAASTAGPTSTTTGASVGELPRPLRRHGQPQRRDARSATRRCGSRRSAGTTCRPTTDALDRMRGLLRDGMAEGAFGLSSGLDYPPGGYATTDELAALAERGRAPRRLLPHPRPLPARRPLPRPVPRGDRDRPAGRRAGPHHPLLPPPDASGRPGADARRWSTTRARTASTSPSTRYPSEWANTRLLIQLPQWVQAGGPGRSRSGSPTARRATGCGPSSRPAAPRTPAPPAGPTSGSAAFHRPENLRWESRTIADVMAETGHDALDVICDLLLSEDLGVGQVTSGPWSETLGQFVAHPVGMVGTDSTFLGDKPAPADLRQLPADPRPVRPGRGAAQPRGGHPQDDLGARGAARPA